MPNTLEKASTEAYIPQYQFNHLDSDSSSEDEADENVPVQCADWRSVGAAKSNFLFLEFLFVVCLQRLERTKRNEHGQFKRDV